MRLRVISLAIVIVLIISLTPVRTLAAQPDSDIVYFNDGSYIDKTGDGSLS